MPLHYRNIWYCNRFRFKLVSFYVNLPADSLYPSLRCGALHSKQNFFHYFQTVRSSFASLSARRAKRISFFLELMSVVAVSIFTFADARTLSLSLFY